MSTTDTMTVYLYQGNRLRFEVRLDATMTVQEFFRVIQHKTTFGIAKEHLRLKVLQEDKWERLYCWRSRTADQKSIYKKSLTHLGIQDQACLKPKWVLSRLNIVALGVVGIAAIPLATPAIMGVSYCVGFVTGALLCEAGMQRVVSKGWVMTLAPDMPSKVLEIRMHT